MKTSNIGFSNIFWQMTKAQATKEKVHKLDSIKIKSSVHSRDSINRMKSKLWYGRKNIANCISHKGLISTKYKELLHCNNKKANNWFFKMGKAPEKMLQRYTNGQYASLFTREMQIKSMNCHFTPLIWLLFHSSMYWQGCRETGILVHYWCECKIVRHGKYMMASQKIKPELLYDWEILSKYLKELKPRTWLGICKLIWIYIIHATQMWMQTKCLLKEEYINKKWHIHTTEYHSVLKVEEYIRTYVTWTLRNYDKWNKPQCTQRQIQHDSHFYEGPRVVKFINNSK